jgi:hypothetical protein
MEYRRAYQRLKEGKMKILPFVRQELWDIREDRRALGAYLQEQFVQEKELTEEQVKIITEHPSKFVNDAEVVFDFLQEITRVEEMKSAIKGTSAFPIGNWIHRFSTFKDIVEAIRREFGFTTDVRRSAITANLIHEIQSNLPVFFEKQNNGRVFPRYLYAQKARTKIQGGLADASTYSGEDLFWLCYFSFPPIIPGRFRTQFLEETVTSGVFLEYDYQKDCFTVGEMQKTLLNLRDHLYNLNAMETDFWWKLGHEFGRKYKNRRHEPAISVSNTDMLPILALADREENIVRLSNAILMALRGDLRELAQVKLRPLSPLSDAEANNQENQITFDEVSRWLDDNTQ